MPSAQCSSSIQHMLRSCGRPLSHPLVVNGYVWARRGPRSAWLTQQTSNPRGSPTQIPSSIQTKSARALPPPETTARRLKGRIEYLRPTVWSRSSSTTRSASLRRMAPSSTSAVVSVHGCVRGRWAAHSTIAIAPTG